MGRQLLANWQIGDALSVVGSYTTKIAGALVICAVVVIDAIELSGLGRVPSEKGMAMHHTRGRII